MRFSVRGCLALLCLLVWTAALAPAQAGDVWSSGGVHPVPLKENTEAATCLGCHGKISQGKYVHTAMAMGCTTCHNIVNKAGTTRVELVSPVNQLCLTCHPPASYKVQHRPYQQGDCIICHSPHASDFPAHTWVSVQDTCLGCHAGSLLKFDAKTKTATLPWGVTLTDKQIAGCPPLGLNASLTANHPVAGHPVSGPNTLLGKNAAPITCLSCHRPHGSNFAHMLIKTPPDPSMPLCKSCSLCVDCHRNL